MPKCLYCGTETEGFFCKGGGITVAYSNTGEKNATKSYCYNDFLSILKITEALGSELSPEEIEFFKWQDTIKEWYKSIQYVKDESHASVAVLN